MPITATLFVKELSPTFRKYKSDRAFRGQEVVPLWDSEEAVLLSCLGGESL